MWGVHIARDTTASAGGCEHGWVPLEAKNEEARDR